MIKLKVICMNQKMKKNIVMKFPSYSGEYNIIDSF